MCIRNPQTKETAVTNEMETKEIGKLMTHRKKRYVMCEEKDRKTNPCALKIAVRCIQKKPGKRPIVKR